MKNKRNSNLLSFLVFPIIAVILIAFIIILNAFLKDTWNINDKLLDTLNSILSAFVVGIFTTIFTQIITHNIFAIKKTNDKLKEFGVEFIGKGTSTSKDTRCLLGNSITNKYPSEVKLLFISGNGYFKLYNKEIFNCLKNSDCIIKILLLSTNPSNKEYIERMEKLCYQKTPYIEQVNSQSIPLLQSIVDKLEKGKKHQLKLRFYKDEYRYNYRIAKYCNNDDVFGRCWLNIQPFNRDAVDLSVGLNGSWDSERSSDNNIYELLDKGFDYLWDEYESTEYKFF